MPLSQFRNLGYFAAPFLFVSSAAADVGNFFFGFGAGSPFLKMAMRMARENIELHPGNVALGRKVKVVKVAGSSMLSSAVLLANSTCIRLLWEQRQLDRKANPVVRGPLGAYGVFNFSGTFFTHNMTGSWNHAYHAKLRQLHSATGTGATHDNK